MADITFKLVEGKTYEKDIFISIFQNLVNYKKKIKKGECKLINLYPEQYFLPWCEHFLSSLRLYRFYELFSCVPLIVYHSSLLYHSPDKGRVSHQCVIPAKVIDIFINQD